MTEEKGPEVEKRGSPSESERLPTSAEAAHLDPGEAWAELVQEIEARGDPRDGPFTLSYSEVVERVLSLEVDLAALRARLEGHLDENSSSSIRPDETGPLISPPSFSPLPSDRSSPSSRDGGLSSPSSEWSGAGRVPCPRGCGAVVRRDNLSRHLRRCNPEIETSL